MVELGQVSRSGFYRFDDDSKPGPDPDMDLRDAIQRIALEWPSYGRPRITAALRRRGWTVNPKRVRRIMREDNLGADRHRSVVNCGYSLDPAGRWIAAWKLNLPSQP